MENDTEEKKNSSPNGALSLPAHCLTAEQCVQELGTDPEDGLTTADAQSRLEKYGRNELGEGEGVSVIKIIIRQVANAMMLVKRPTIPFLRFGQC
jgi:Na+-exporting ATPase